MRLLKAFIVSILPVLSMCQDVPGQCLNERWAKHYTKTFGDILSQVNGYRNLANTWLRSDMVSNSDSLAYIYEQPMNQTNYHSRDAWLHGVRDFHPGPWTTYFLSWTCDTITWYKSFTVDRVPIRCMEVLFIDIHNKKIKKNLWEFNSGAGLHQYGKPDCKPGWDVRVGREPFNKQKAHCGGSGPL